MHQLLLERGGNNHIFIGNDVLTAVDMSVAIFWDIAPRVHVLIDVSGERIISIFRFNISRIRNSLQQVDRHMPPKCRFTYELHSVTSLKTVTVKHKFQYTYLSVRNNGSRHRDGNTNIVPLEYKVDTVAKLHNLAPSIIVPCSIFRFVQMSPKASFILVCTNWLWMHVAVEKK
jgi:hypothetical protein